MTKPFIILIFLLMQSCVSGGSTRLPEGYSSWYEASLPSAQESLKRIADKECCDEN